MVEHSQEVSKDHIRCDQCKEKVDYKDMPHTCKCGVSYQLEDLGYCKELTVINGKNIDYITLKK